MMLKDVLLKPIKLIGGGVLDLKGFNKSIIDKEVVKEFPYEYDVVNFTVNVKAEDWTIDTDESFATCNIHLDNPISLQKSNFIWGFLNNTAHDNGGNMAFTIYVAGLDWIVTLNVTHNAITSVYIDVFFGDSFTPPENYKLEFKNLIFV